MLASIASRLRDPLATENDKRYIARRASGYLDCNTKVILRDAFHGRQNNFDAIRLAAALLVLASHSFPVTGQPEFFRHLLGGYASGGGLAVAIFFTISGLLVTKSVLTHPLPVYVASRALRILPALGVVTLFQIFIVGAIFTKLPIDAYFSHPQTLKHLGNAFVFWISFPLPAVFIDNPGGGAVNSSLWTLPVECFCYMLLPLMLFLGLLNRWAILGVVGSFLVAFLTMKYGLGWDFRNFGGLIFRGVPTYRFAFLGLFFFAGAAFWVWRDKIRLSRRLALVLVGLAALGPGTAFGDLFYVSAVAYGVLVVAFALPTIDLRPLGDLSYGTYLFAFPIQQSLVALFGAAIDAWWLTALATPIVLALAFLSWRLVERPALEVRRRWQGQTT